MRKSAAIIVLVVIAISGFVVGLVTPGEVAAHNQATILECYIVPAWPCVLQCCYTEQTSGCFPIGCAPGW